MRRGDIVLLLASCLVAVGIAEIGLRIAWTPEHEQRVIREHPIYGWALQPGARLHSVASDRGLDYLIEVNSHGLRDRERSPDRSPNRHRVLFLGDSMVFGAGVQAEARCSARLEELLGGEAEVWNAGVSGWGTDQEFLWMCRDGFELEPDVVVLGLCMMNDVLNVMLSHELFGTAPKPRFVLQDGDLSLELPAARPAPTLGRRMVGFAKHSRLLHFVGRHVRLLQVARRAAPPKSNSSAPYYPEDLETDSSHWSVYRLPYSQPFEAAFRTTEAIVEALEDSCAAHHAQLILFAWPEKVEVDRQARAAELAHYGYDPSWFDLDAPYARLQRLADRLQMPFVYPLAGFEDLAKSEPLFFARDGHANAAGHAAAAEALAPVVHTALHRSNDSWMSGR